VNENGKENGVKYAFDGFEVDPANRVLSRDESDKALATLEDAYQKTPIDLLGIRILPSFFNLRGNPRFEALLTKLDNP